MNNGPTLQKSESPETIGVMPPMGWVKLPSGESFALADVVALGETKESFDKDADLTFFYFNIGLTCSTVKCILYDAEDTLESEAKTRNQLEYFRDQIAIARWGEHCVEMKDEELAMNMAFTRELATSVR